MDTFNKTTINSNSDEARPSLGKAIEDHTATTVKATKKGEYIRLKPNGPVWIRGEFCRSGRNTYEIQSADDINRVIYRKGTTVIYTGFTY